MADLPAVDFASIRRVVVKLGTGILTSGIGQLNEARIAEIAAQIAELWREGRQVIVVSSGAVGLGMGRLGLAKRPTKVAALQKCAAVGQSILTETWQKAFGPHGIIVAQLLLTREDVRSRRRHVAVRELIEELAADRIVPIINENDSISSAEIKLMGFGDNDVLSALVASLSKADLLAILSTAPGLIDRAGTGEIIPVVPEISDDIRALAGGSDSVTGTGGMVTKLEAVSIATHGGCTAFIGSGAEPDILRKLFAGVAPGTLFLPSAQEVGSRKRWIAHFKEPHGQIFVDAGAERALREKGSSLLAKGVTNCDGQFSAGDVVEILGPNGLFARGVSGFDAAALEQVCGKRNEEIAASFPAQEQLEVVHRDELVLLS